MPKLPCPYRYMEDVGCRCNPSIRAKPGGFDLYNIYFKILLHLHLNTSSTYTLILARNTHVCIMKIYIMRQKGLAGSSKLMWY